MVTLTAGSQCLWTLQKEILDVNTCLEEETSEECVSLIFILPWKWCFLYDSHSCFSLVIFLNFEIQHWLSAKSATFLPSYPKGAYGQIWRAAGDGNGSSPMGTKSPQEIVWGFMSISHMRRTKLDRLIKAAHRLIFYENIMYIWKQIIHPEQRLLS